MNIERLIHIYGFKKMLCFEWSPPDILFWRSFWYSIWQYTLTFYLAVSHTLSDILSDIPCILTFYFLFYLTCVLVQACPTASGANDLVLGSRASREEARRRRMELHLCWNPGTLTWQVRKKQKNTNFHMKNHSCSFKACIKMWYAPQNWQTMLHQFGETGYKANLGMPTHTSP